MSKIVWDKLPKEYQELFFECAVEAEELERRRFQEVEQNSLDKFIEHGLTYCEITGKLVRNGKKVISYVYPRYPKIVTDEYLATSKNMPMILAEKEFSVKDNCLNYWLHSQLCSCKLTCHSYEISDYERRMAVTCIQEYYGRKN